MNNGARTMFLAMMALLVFGCSTSSGREEPADAGDDASMDGSMDTDSDTDSDTDGDADGDGDADADADAGMPGNTCENPIQVTGTSYQLGEPWSVFTHTSNLGAGCTAAPGPDVWFRVLVPSGQCLFAEETGPAETYVTTVGTCTNQNCSLNEDDPEDFVWENPSLSDMYVTLVVASTEADPAGDAVVDLRIGEPPRPDGGFSCDAPIVVSQNPYSVTVDLADYGESFDSPGSCSTQNGVDVWFQIDVPGMARLNMAQTNVDLDAVVSLVDSCPPTDCLVSNDYDDAIVYLNPGGTTARLLGVVSAYYYYDLLPADVMIDLEPLGDKPGVFCTNPIEVDAGTFAWTEDMAGFENTFDGNTGCVSETGQDAWFHLALGPSEYLQIAETEALFDEVLSLVSSCGTTACFASTDSDTLNYLNDTGATRDVYVVLSAYSSYEYDIPQLSMNVSPILEGDMCDNAIPIGALVPEDLDAGVDGSVFEHGGDLADHHDFLALDGGAGCNTVQTSGAEVVFGYEIPAMSAIRISESGPVQAAVKIKRDCAPGAACLLVRSDTVSVITYQNDTVSADYIYIIVEPRNASGPTAYHVTVTRPY